MKLLITGAAGMLAGHLAELLVNNPNHSVVWSDLASPRPFLSPHPLRSTTLLPLDICDRDMVRKVIASEKPDWVVNLAAYTAVDQAESDPKNAFQVNAIGPMNLALECAPMGARLLHISSDYVFGGYTDRANPFAEEDQLRPTGIYGQSKALGDENVLAANPGRSLVLRTSWLHGLYGPNFVDTIMKAGREREELKVVDDQFGSPTWAGWLAKVILGSIECNLSGVFHASGNSASGISWFDFAQEIVRQGELPCRVARQSSHELSRPAPRPPYSVLNTEKLHRTLNLLPVSWQEGLCEHLALRGAEQC